MVYFLFLITLVLSAIVQWSLNSRFEKYSRVFVSMSGAEVAKKMLSDNGITDVKVMHVSGKLTDHYNPIDKTLNLSDSVYMQRNIAAAAVAAHECGHALQHAKGYVPLKMRSALVPAVNFANRTLSWILLLGILTVQIFPMLLGIGVMLFAVTTLFSFVTLPVEINASRRAVAYLDQSGIADSQTRPMAVKALKSAAYTYVVAALSSLATLLYYLSLLAGRRR